MPVEFHGADIAGMRVLGFDRDFDPDDVKAKVTSVLEKAQLDVHMALSILEDQEPANGDQAGSDYYASPVYQHGDDEETAWRVWEDHRNELREQAQWTSEALESVRAGDRERAPMSGPAAMRRLLGVGG